MRGRILPVAPSPLQPALQLSQHVQPLVNLGDDGICVCAGGREQRRAGETPLHVASSSSPVAPEAGHGVFVAPPVEVEAAGT